MMMCSRCKKRPAVVFISSMQGTERRNEGLCLRCAKEMGLPQVDEYLKQMGISEEDFENAYDSMFDENGNPDPELLKNIGFEDITNGFKPHDSDTTMMTPKMTSTTPTTRTRRTNCSRRAGQTPCRSSSRRCSSRSRAPSARTIWIS